MSKVTQVYNGFVIPPKKCVKKKNMHPDALRENVPYKFDREVWFSQNGNLLFFVTQYFRASVSLRKMQ
jgi:hypothetical protein